MTSDIYLSLGSNSGDRYAMIGKAVAALTDIYAALNCTVRVAEPITSMPQGFDSPNPFVNVGVLVNVERPTSWTPLELEALLGTTQAVERVLSGKPHRNPDGSYRDREIDVDIIAVDTIEYSSPSLTLPHPRLAEREFVLKPMSQLLPNWVHPTLGLTPDEMLENLKPSSTNK